MIERIIWAVDGVTCNVPMTIIGILTTGGFTVLGFNDEGILRIIWAIYL